MGLESELQLLERRARSALVRLRLNRALAVFARWLPFGLAIGGLSVLSGKLRLFDPSTLTALSLLSFASAALAVSAAVRAAARPLPWQTGSLALDRQQGLSDVVTNALEFSRIPKAKRTALMDLVIEEGALVAGRIHPARAVSLHLPKQLLVSAFLLVAVALLFFAELPAPPAPVQPTPKAPLAFSPASDDLQMMREMAEQWQQTSTNSQAQQATRRFNQLLEDLAQQKLDKHQVLERLAEISRQLGEPNADRQAALDDALQGIARALQTSAQTKTAANALSQKNLPDAEKALRELAQKLRQKNGVDKKQLEELRRALQAAAAESGQRLERLTAERRKVEEAKQRLLRKKGGAESKAATQDQLTQQKRQLERLSRQQHQAELGHGQLTELERQLAEAAQRLFEDMGQGADHVQAGADDLSRMNKEKLSEKEQQELKKQLEALHELLRQQAKGGQQREGRLREFARHARGNSPGDASSGGEKSGAVALGLSQSGALLPLPGSGEGKTTGSQPGAAGPQGSQGQGQAPGAAAGNGTDPNLTGASSPALGRTQDVTAAGIDSGEGPSASSIVHGAAERGFVGGGYKRVYTEYKTVAEESLAKDQIPAGYEAYVRRYFQLIRPRD